MTTTPSPGSLRRWARRLAVALGALVVVVILAPWFGPLLGAHFGDAYARRHLAPALAKHDGEQRAAIRRSSWFPSDAVVEELRGALTNPTVSPLVRLDVVAALGRIGTPRALGVLDAGWAAEPPTSWWRPPLPAEPLRTAASAPTPLVSELGCRVDAPEGSPEAGIWLLFREPAVNTLWWVRMPAEGQNWPPSRFLGWLPKLQDDPLHCELTGSRLSLHVDEPATSCTVATRTRVGEFDLTTLDDDADDDGLTDLYEHFLTTDPQLADTDGDGVPDGIDLAPTSGGQVEEDWATSLRDVVAAFSGPVGDEHDVLFVPAHPGAEWRRAGGPTIRIPPGSSGPLSLTYAYPSFESLSLFDLVDSPSELLAEVDWQLSGRPPRYLLPGGCFGMTDIRMRRIEERWYIADVRQRSFLQLWP